MDKTSASGISHIKYSNKLEIAFHLGTLAVIGRNRRIIILIFFLKQTGTFHMPCNGFISGTILKTLKP